MRRWELTSDLCRAGRALADLPQRDLAELSGVSESTIRNFESGRSKPIRNNLDAIERVLEKCGVEFILLSGGQVAVAKRRLARPTGAAAAHARPPREEAS